MIKNYILIAWRNLLKNRLFSFINIIGLALSMSVCMIVLIRIMDAMSYDNFHQDSKRLYRIISEVENEQGYKTLLASTPLPLAQNLSKDSLLVEEAIHLYPALHDLASDGSKEFTINGIFTQPAFFKIFGFQLKHGDPETALIHPNSIVLSEITADKFYGDVNPVGKLITLNKFGTFQITGVFKTAPSKSHINYDAFAASSSVVQLEKDGKLLTLSENWDTFEKGYTYIKLQPNVAEETFAKFLENFSTAFNKSATQGSFHFKLQPISSITPAPSEMYNDIGRGPTRGSLMAEVSIVLVILLAASFNYTNLSVARALTRGKEVGIRKLAGAQRWHIFVQYIFEAVIIALLALIIAQIILGFILEYKPFNDGYELVPSVSFSFKLLLVFILFSAAAGIMAGAMPAWILSSFKPVSILRNVGSVKIMGSISLRKALMVFQFALSLLVLIFLSAFYNQFDYLAKADPGFNRSNIMLIPLHGKKEVIASVFNTISGVKKIGFTSNALGHNVAGNVKASTQHGDTQPVTMDYYYGDKDLISIMKLKIVAGTNFNESVQDDHSILLNEKAVHALGFQNAEAAIGTSVFFNDTIPFKIQGVINDFYYSGYGNPIRPLTIRNKSDQFRYVVVETEEEARSTITSRIEETWKKINPEKEFTYQWLDKNLNALSGQSAEISLLGYLGFMTVTIASMGLLGLVVYTIETRRKEISIRKIAGASVPQLMILLSSGYVNLLNFSGIIALPLGYLLSELFLMGFTNRAEFGIVNLILCYFLLLSIGLITILPQTYNASTENPSRNLRSE